MANKIINKTDQLFWITVLRGFSAFLVVCGHTPYEGKFGEYFRVFISISVPIFFIITGYFFVAEKTRQQLFKIIKLIIISNSVYFIWNGFIEASKGLFSAYLAKIFTVKNFIIFLLFNKTHIQNHLWYLCAILYVYVFISLILKCNFEKSKFLYILTPILLLGDLCLGKYSRLLWNKEFPYVLVRNWLFVGIPYFTIGMFIKDNTERIKRKFSKRITILIVIITTLTGFFEHWILVRADLNVSREHYISTTFTAVSLFLFFLFYVEQQKSFISEIGRNDSTWIYIFHQLVKSVLDKFTKILNIDFIYSYIRPIIVFLVTFFMIEAVRKIAELSNNKRKRLKL